MYEASSTTAARTETPHCNRRLLCIMDVANGTEAGVAWKALVYGGLDCDERDRIRKALLDYCGQDTLAMVRLVERLRSVSI